MSKRYLRIAVISDLHCHPKKTKPEEGADDTYLLSDKLRTPTNDHPVESLLKIIKESNIEVDLTLCPGDFTNKASVQGFIAGWNYSLEIHRNLNSKEIIATVGNHDVDSYNGFSNYSLEIAKGIKQGFPIINEQECDTFWSKGCVFLERPDFRLLLINSSHYHFNKTSAKSGKVGDDLIEYVDTYLSNINDTKIQIALSHHHPIDHSRLRLGEEDKIINGDELLNILGKYGFDLFIHGHKHDPLLRYFNTTNGNIRVPIFSAGSFSSSTNLMFTSVRNTFHIIDIIKESSTSGTIKTWTFFPNSGWKINLDESGFAPYSGFGNTKTIEEIFNSIVALLNTQKSISWSEIRANIKEVDNLIPADSLELSDLLKKNGYLLDENIWKNPTKIFNINQ